MTHSELSRRRLIKPLQPSSLEEPTDAESHDAKPHDAEPHGAEPNDAEPYDSDVEPCDAETYDGEPCDAETYDGEPYADAESQPCTPDQETEEDAGAAEADDLSSADGREDGHESDE